MRLRIAVPHLQIEAYGFGGFAASGGGLDAGLDASGRGELESAARAEDDGAALGDGDACDGTVCAAAAEPAGDDGVTGFGAETPATLEPRPSFWRLKASILPLASRPFED